MTDTRCRAACLKPKSMFHMISLSPTKRVTDQRMVDRYEIQEVRYINGCGPLSGQTFGFDVDGKTFPTYAEAKAYADRLLLSMQASGDDRPDGGKHE